MNDTSSDEILLLKQRLAEQEALNAPCWKNWPTVSAK